MITKGEPGTERLDFENDCTACGACVRKNGSRYSEGCHEALAEARVGEENITCVPVTRIIEHSEATSKEVTTAYVRAARERCCPVTERDRAVAVHLPIGTAVGKCKVCDGWVYGDDVAVRVPQPAECNRCRTKLDQNETGEEFQSRRA